jgi:hypothetical protein
VSSIDEFEQLCKSWRRQGRPVLFDVFAQLFNVRQQRPHGLPEVRAVMQMTGVGQFVQDDVIDQRPGQLHQVIIQRDLFLAGTAAPSGAQAFYPQRLIFETIGDGQLPKPDRQ